MIELLFYASLAVIAFFLMWTMLALQYARQASKKIDRFIGEAYDSLPIGGPWREVETLSARVREQIIKSYPMNVKRLSFWLLRTERKIIACETWEEWLELEL